MHAHHPYLRLGVRVRGPRATLISGFIEVLGTLLAVPAKRMTTFLVMRMVRAVQAVGILASAAE